MIQYNIRVFYKMSVHLWCWALPRWANLLKGYGDIVDFYDSYDFKVYYD